MAETKLIDRLDRITRKRGNGVLRREVWIDDVTGIVTRYNLAYINHIIFAGDNGRVLGFDNKHGLNHRHFKGTVEEVYFESFEAVEQRFEDEWLALRGDNNER
jgi:hypothetical protein